MKRSRTSKPMYWGEFKDGSDVRRETRKLKKHLTEKQTISKLVKEDETEKVITIDNPLVTQTVEVMNQTEMIQGLIDTYEYTTSNSDNTYGPNQVMPNIDLPLDTTADLSKSDKFSKPIWFISPTDTKFVRGCPQNYPQMTKPVVMEAMRKSLAGMLQLKSFNECTESALVMFMDAVDEFYKSLLESVNQTLSCQYKDKIKHLDVATLEKGYYALTNSSLTTLHNYYKNEVLLKNKSEIKEFKDIFQDYEKLKQESQSIQKYQIGDDYMGILGFTSPPASSIYSEGGGVNIMNYLSTDNASSGYENSSALEHRVKTESNEMSTG